MIQTKKIALYIRVSVADRNRTGTGTKNESNSITSQRATIHHFLDTKEEFRNCKREEFIDDGFSGTTDQRPQFQELLDQAYQGEISTIIVRDLSRFFREYTESGNYLECVFPCLGIRFVSINDSYDSNDYIGTTGGLEIAMRNIVYSAYSKDLSNKVRTAKTTLMKQGKYMGTTPPYGYVKHPVEKHRLVVDRSVSPIVEKIFRYASEGCKVNEIVKILNCEQVKTPVEHLRELYPNNQSLCDMSKIKKPIWQYDGVRRILKNQIYTGSVVSGSYRKEHLGGKKKKMKPIVVAGMHEAIVSHEVFAEAQAIFTKTNPTTKRNIDTYSLKGLMKCGHCGRSLARKKRVTTSNVYTCLYCRQLTEPVVYAVKEDVVEEMVWQEVLEHVERVQAEQQECAKATKSHKVRVATLEKRVEELRAEKKSLYRNYVGDALTREAYLQESKRIDMKMEMVQSDIAEAIVRSKKRVIPMRDEGVYSPCFTKSAMATALPFGSQGYEALTPELAKQWVEKVVVHGEDHVMVVMKD
ncbi:MAG: recombinase family protein [Bacillota bacterium]